MRSARIQISRMTMMRANGRGPRRDCKRAAFRGSREPPWPGRAGSPRPATKTSSSTALATSTGGIDRPVGGARHPTRLFGPERPAPAPGRHRIGNGPDAFIKRHPAHPSPPMTLVLTLASRNLFQYRLRFVATVIGLVVSIVLVI